MLDSINVEVKRLLLRHKQSRNFYHFILCMVHSYMYVEYVFIIKRILHHMLHARVYYNSFWCIRVCMPALMCRIFGRISTYIKGSARSSIAVSPYKGGLGLT